MSFNIVFMGTSDFAKEFLEYLYLKKNFFIKAVYTQPPRKSERGQKINRSPVHKFAEENNIKVFCPEKLSNDDVNNLKKINPDNLIVVSYGLIIPNQILMVPSGGAINVHASMLPRWRGAAPIQRAILNGDETTGISIMKIEEGLDQGPTYMQSQIEIKKNDTYQDVYNNLIDVGQSTLDKFFSIDVHLMPVRQNNSIATYAKKIKKNETQIDFDSNAADVHNKIRAFSPKPGAWFALDSKKYKIFDSKLISQKEISNIEIKKNLILKFKKDYLVVKKIQKEGRNILVIEDFARGQAKELENIRKKLGPSDKI